MKKKWHGIPIALVSVLLVLVLGASSAFAVFSDVETSTNTFQAGTLDDTLELLEVNGESPWTSPAFNHTNVKPGEELSSFPVRFKNIGTDPGELTFGMSYEENDIANAPEPNMTAHEFASLVYIAAVTHQYFCPAYPDGGSIRNDLPNWLADGMDLNVDGKISLYELAACSPLLWASETGDTLPVGDTSEFIITFCLGDSLEPFEAGGAILTGVGDDTPQGDGISVTITATLAPVPAP